MEAPTISLSVVLPRSTECWTNVNHLFTALALYPPFPNALLFLNGILSSDINIMWYLIVIVIFFGNFLIAMRVMAKTVFGKPNDNVHYIDIALKERWLHLAIFALLLVLSIVGLRGGTIMSILEKLNAVKNTVPHYWPIGD